MVFLFPHATPFFFPLSYKTKVIFVENSVEIRLNCGTFCVFTRIFRYSIGGCFGYGYPWPGVPIVIPIRPEPCISTVEYTLYFRALPHGKVSRKTRNSNFSPLPVSLPIFWGIVFPPAQPLRFVTGLSSVTEPQRLHRFALARTLHRAPFTASNKWDILHAAPMCAHRYRLCDKKKKRPIVSSKRGAFFIITAARWLSHIYMFACLTSIIYHSSTPFVNM